MSEVMLFEPRVGKKMFQLYPELKEMAEFRDLRDKELRFVWWFANPTSPLVTKGYTNRTMMIRKAIEESWGDTMAEDDLSAYLEGNFPEKIKVAIKRMKAFDVDTRNRAKNMADKIFDNLEKLIKFDESDFEIHDKEGKKIGVDWTAKKAYTDMAAKVSENLPGLIKQVEEGFGISNKKDEKSTGNPIDDYHSERN